MASERRPALCVCGLRAEAAIARKAGFAALIGGGDPQLTARRLDAALADAERLVSFGIAGGLHPDLKTGRVVLSGEVIGEGGYWRGDDDWLGRIAGLARELGAATGPVLDTGRIVATAAEKSQARRETGAVAADLESAIVARAASEAGIPFIVLRAIADAAPRNLPAAALIPLRSDGRPRIGRVLMSAAAHPGQIPALIALAHDTAQALAALAAPAAALFRLLEAEQGSRRGDAVGRIT